MFWRLRFWARIIGGALRERFFGIRCRCGAHAWLPIPTGWHHHTTTDGGVAWHCPDCERQEADHLPW